MRKQYTAEERKRLIAEVRATAERMSVVAERQGVTPSSAYFWLKEAATVAPVEKAPAFVRVVPKRVAALRVEVEARFSSWSFASVFGLAEEANARVVDGQDGTGRSIRRCPEEGTVSYARGCA